MRCHEDQIAGMPICGVDNGFVRHFVDECIGVGNNAGIVGGGFGLGQDCGCLFGSSLGELLGRGRID